MKTLTKTFTFSLVILTCLCLSSYGKNSLTESSQGDVAVVESQEFENIKVKAARGDIEAKYLLAHCYNRGLYGCKIDNPQAKELYQTVAKYANENLAAVQHCKGICYLNGYGVDKDKDEAQNGFVRRLIKNSLRPNSCLDLTIKMA